MAESPLLGDPQAEFRVLTNEEGFVEEAYVVEHCSGETWPSTA